MRILNRDIPIDATGNPHRPGLSGLSARIALALAMLSVVGILVSPVSAQVDSDSTTVSYWGPFPERADSVMSSATPIERDAWEYCASSSKWDKSAQLLMTNQLNC